jgi:hypothetical protein
MFKFLSAVMIAAVATVAGFAQTSDYKKGEFFVGYSNGQVDTGVDSGNSAVDFFRDRENFNGINVSGVYNFNRYVGLKGDVSATYNNTEVSDTFQSGGLDYTIGFEAKNSLYNVLGGVQIKDNEKAGTFKPFAHALVGVGHARTKITDFGCVTPVGGNCAPFEIGDETFSDTGLAGAFGGGIDIRLNDSVQIRAIQVDYNPIRIAGTTAHNVRFGVGLVF